MKPSKRTESKEHPFKLWLAQKQKTQGWAIEQAASMGESLSQSHLSEVMSGSTDPSVRLLDLLQRIAGDKVTAAEMIAWHQRHLSAAGKGEAA